MNRIDTDTAHRIWNNWLTTAGFKSELLNPCDLIRMVEGELENRNSQYGALAIDRYNQPWHPEMEKRNEPSTDRLLINVRHLYITKGTTSDKLWIGDWISGEGGDFSKDKFYAVLRDFFSKEF